MQLCNPLNYQQIWVRIPLVYPFDYRATTLSTFDGWSVWNQLRHNIGHSKHIFAALEINEELSDDLFSDPSILQRWCGEPIRAVILPTRIFLTNQKQFPVLSKRLQMFLKSLMKYKLHIILKGRPYHCGGVNYVPYFQYLRHLHSVCQSDQLQSLTAGEISCNAYNDTLQAPLQPLMDNLESQTYETFEKDPIKYAQYEAAISKALHEMIQRKQFQQTRRKSESDSVPLLEDLEDLGENDSASDQASEGHQDRIIVMVVGAGRGPLVAAALSASFQTSIPVKVYAVEKNRNAVITLRNRCKAESWDNVEVVAMDMRKWNPPVMVYPYNFPPHSQL